MADRWDSVDVGKPFLRWAGGKSWLLPHLRSLFTASDFRAYHEPFLGGGAAFFGLVAALRRPSVLSDANGDLIATYVEVRDNVEAVISALEPFENTARAYYRARASIPKGDAERAARFIYLNQTSFNGIYRVNLRGEYNVPFGYRSKEFLDARNLRMASRALQSATLESSDFESVLARAAPGDLVFLDPPYTVSHNSNGFVKYNSKLFSLADQVRLVEVTTQLNDRGVHYVLTNAAHSTIAEMFDPVGRRVEVKRYSRVGGTDARRGVFAEYVFTNLEIV